MEQTELAARELEDVVSGYLEAFNRMDLDAVMEYFALNAHYEPGDGTMYYGRRAVRRAFLPQFSNAWGAMVFDEVERIVDEATGRVVLRWICRMDARKARFYSWPLWLVLRLGMLKAGKKAGFKGIDVLHFNREGKIERKYTYANCARPKILRSLGEPLRA